MEWERYNGSRGEGATGVASEGGGSKCGLGGRAVRWALIMSGAHT